MSPTAIFVDVVNLYHCIYKKYNNRRLDYQKYLETALKEDMLIKAVAYGTQTKDNMNNFIACLKHIGYITKFAEPIQRGNRKIILNPSVAMALDIVRISDKVKNVIIGSTSLEILPIIDWLNEKEISVKVVACGIPKLIRENVVQSIEIPEDLLEAQK